MGGAVEAESDEADGVAPPAVTQLEAAHRAAAPAKIKTLEEDADEAAKILTSAKAAADKAVARASAQLPRST